MALTTAQIQNAYVAFFNRPADVAGLNYWTAYTGSLQDLYNTFAQSSEYTTAFANLSSTAAVNQVYTNLLGHAPDVAGLNYWVLKLDQKALKVADLALAVVNGAQGTDVTVISNKVSAATTYTGSLDTAAKILAYATANTTAMNAVKQWLGAVTDVASTLTTATSSATLASLSSTVSSNSTSNQGQTYTLAASADTLTAGSGDDTINGFNDTTASSTLTAADSIDGGAGNDTLNLTISTNAVTFPAASIKNVETVNVRAAGSALTAADLSLFSGVTAFNSDRSTAALTVTNLSKGGSFGVIGDGNASNANTLAFGYAAAADVATLNLSGGIKGPPAITLTGTGVTSTIINVNGSAANTTGVITTAATSKAITINASANLTGTLTTTADTKLTVTGSGTVDVSGTNFGSALNNAIVTIDASAQTAGGVKVQAGNSTTLKFTGGAGNDSLGLGAVLAATSAADGGAGTDTLYVAGNSAYITAGTGAFIKNFEVVDVTTATVDLDNLATNNTLTGLRVGGSATVSNINAATSGNITIYANATPVLNVKGATTPGQLDTVSIDVNDGAAAVNTITLTAPTLTGVETLKLNATDSATVTSLANALALTGITVTGAGATSITTTAIALNPNTVVDASAATGNFTLDATGATANGYTIKGSAGTNILTGGNAPIAVDITKSVAKADQVIVTSATGSTASVLQTISGFTNALTTDRKSVV